MERQSKGPRDLEAYCRGGQGPPRAVAPTDDDDDDNSTGNSCDSNIINYTILLPKNLLLKLYNFEHRNKMKFKAPQK